MADVEFLHSPTTLEPTFVKPMDSASRRRSRASYESAAVSTRSWVLLHSQSQNQNQPNSPPPAEPIPLPEPVPALAPATSPSVPASRPLPEPPRRESNTENIDLPYPGLGLGYHWTMGHGTKAREAHPQKEKGGGSGGAGGFVGGFVSGLRRLPRALVRTRQRPRRGTMHTEEGTEGTDMTGNTLPQYVSDPNTPVVPGSTVAYGGIADAIREDETMDAGRAARAQRLSFRVVPPASDDENDGFIRQGPIVGDLPEVHVEGEAGGPSVLEFPQTPLENPYDRDAAGGAPSMQRVPSAVATPRVSRADDRLAVPLPSNEGGLDDEPSSIQAHPQPTEDYRRMSAADAQARSSRHTTIDSPNNNNNHHNYHSTGGDNSFANSPSFSSELNGFARFFNALHLLPWVATDRLTVDYRPKYKSQNLVSWYHPKGESAAIERERDVARERAREIAGTDGASPPSRTRSPAPRRNRSTHRTTGTHRRRQSIPEPPASAPPTTQGYGFPAGTPYYYYPAFSPAPSPSPPPTHASRRQSPRRQHPPRHHHHHRRSASYPSQPHPHPQTPWIQSASPLLPAPPAPVYVIQASPPPPSPPPTSSMQATPGGSPVPPDQLHPQAQGFLSPALDPAKSPHPHGQMQVLAPVYMQMQLFSPSSSPAGGVGADGSGSPQQVAFVPGGYGYGVGGAQGYVPAYSSPTMGWQSPIAVPAPVQVVGG
ncbi:hypothetical protein R3P38DRAFT_600916 [Favolaschia claudopus]|uniref:Uncharacterized protein n=1 Tax=Favolaschia claudopus TaxID=2862362 RepID=A0AAV9Z788_9AGAR